MRRHPQAEMLRPGMKTDTKRPELATDAPDANSLLDASHLSKNLNRRMAKGGAITIGSQVAKLVLRLVSGAVLARLLTPADFGVVALVTVVTGFIELFKDAGLSMATIQRKTLLQSQISALFWINVILATVIMLVEILMAPAIAWFYKDSRLTSITIALACLTIFGGLAVQHQALLRRNMQFGRLALIEIGSQVIGMAVAVYMACHDYGYWSLVGLTAGSAVSTAILSFLVSGWIPSWPARAEGVGDMIKYGGNLAGANFFNYFTRNADNFIVGYLNGPASLGIYSRAYTIFLMPMQQFLAPVSSVVIPALSRAADDPPQFRKIILEKSYFVLFFVVLATGLSFVAAPELVRILLGPDWSAVVPIVRCLAVGGAIYGTNVAGGWVSSTRGNSHRQLRVALIAGPLYAASYVIGGYLYGAIGVACAFSIMCALLRYPVFAYLLKGSPISPNELITPLFKVGAIAALATIPGLLLTNFFPELNLVSMLAVKTACYFAIFTGAWLIKFLPFPKISLSN
jgi:O-antigen/teichoic acid export membrane protein